MDEQVKARLIGATVLVVIAVALVPELLSGPGRRADDSAEATGKRGTRIFTIDLSGGSGDGKAELLPKPAADARDNTRLPTVAPPGPAAAEQDRGPAAVTEPAEPVKAVAAAAQARSPEPVIAAPSATIKPPVPQTAVPVAAKGGWAVQVGAFGSAATAGKLVADLERDGYAAYVAPLTRSGKTLHRVRVGPQPSRADAEQLAIRLKDKGLPGAVVAAQ